ncbi:AidA/PixA family protein [uncultured Acetobacteroides sp.]|uniref:AidA/PixA family protein n=1 Tax=uncultured Acetobacteroides sp. TaxID=1760811 RepID=UPI0029F5BB81|nr:AidA/PixA family protein [uncultured Acetobacteroides sp.]
MIRKEAENNEIRDMLALKSTQQILYVNTTIDTQAIIDHPEWYAISKDPNNPTMINTRQVPDPNDPKKTVPFNPIYMVATYNSSMYSGTTDLKVNAQVGDHICWASQSETSNMDHAAYIYKIFGDENVFYNTTTSYHNYQKEVKVPSRKDPLTLVSETRTFPFVDAAIENRGSEAYHFCFEVYKRGTDGTQQLYGYFKEDPRIEVKQ